MKNNIAYMLAVVTMLLFAGCSNEDASDYIHHNFDRNFDIAEVFTASWIVDGNNVGKCKLLMSSEYVGFSNIPYKTICSKVFSEDEMKDFNVSFDISKSYLSMMILQYRLTGYSATGDSYYYDYLPLLHTFRVHVNGTEYTVAMSVSGTGTKMKTPYSQLLSNLVIDKIKVEGTDRECSTPQKIVNIAKL